MERGDDIEVLLAAFVVEQNLALGGVLDRLGGQFRAFGSRADGGFESVVGRARVTVRVRSNRLQKVVRSSDMATAEAMLFIHQGAAEAA